MPPVIGRAGRWLIDGIVVFFAVYAFVFLPLGRETAYDHLRAILDTGAAKNAGRELVSAADRLRQNLLGGDRGDRGDAVKARGRPKVPKLPKAPPPQLRVARANVSDVDTGPDASVVY
jgi:hypothetical protein